MKVEITEKVWNPDAKFPYPMKKFGNKNRQFNPSCYDVILASLAYLFWSS